MDFGDIIRLKREQMHLTQTQLAELLGISQPTISGMERDTSQAVPFDLACFLIDALNLDRDMIFDMMRQKYLHKKTNPKGMESQSPSPPAMEGQLRLNGTED